ncbi:hypothetical protein EXIGLDRAFT_609271 [Exidia glandulosa HHB12029]|uniref:VLRF1 domain-containing protein n=1 Tax=Exidia glandulosa HHB12029 TaxID=1314781 RepID=A0A165KIL5_EXIGL|nr:hypothetical protein EXIGLDRAFT_609271 [Exidia glandulosa HHB12029]
MSLYLYDLPRELLDTLTARGVTALEEPEPDAAPEPARVAQTNAASGRSCGVCQGASFADLDDQRAHFRSDWHRYNVKARLANGKTVTEQEFASLVDGLDHSISGSESSDEESSDRDAVHDLIARASRDPTRPASPDDSDAVTKPRSSITWFHSPPSTQIGVYNAIFPSHLQPTSYVDALRDMQRGGEDGRIWTVFMTAGGHFAGVVVRVCPADPEEGAAPSKAAKHRKGKQHIEVLRHKTFHRYTTRRKQGGSQSVNDNAKGPAKSAGAQLRRYGEQALREDIRGLLAEWKEDIDMSELIWIRASVSNRRTFYDYDEAPFDKRDERLRTFPFPTRRPTQAEITRCINELTYVKTSHLTEDALRAQEEAYLASLPKPKPQPVITPATPAIPKPAAPKLSPEEEALRDRWRRVLEMVQKGRLEPLQAFWTRDAANLGGVDAILPPWIGERSSTLLQLAARAGQEEVVRWLLEDQHADPTIPLDADDIDDAPAPEEDGYTSDAPPTKSGRRTAYDVAANKGVRNVFRRCAWAHPDWWDWHGTARVGSALSPEMEEGRDDKKKARRKGLKDKMREREARAPTPEPEPAPPPPKPTKKEEPTTGPRKLGGASGAQDGVAGLSAEMRARVERERRARAAEARMKALGGG